jgi:hypothetical protein
MVLELRSSAYRAGTGSFSAGAWDPLLNPWKEATCFVEPRIPRPETFRMPKRDEWEEFWKGEVDGDPAARAALLRRLLEAKRTSFEFVELRLRWVLVQVLDDLDQPLTVDPNVGRWVDLDRLITASAPEVSLRNALDRILAADGHGLRLHVTAQGTLLLTDRWNPDLY